MVFLVRIGVRLTFELSHSMELIIPMPRGIINLFTCSVSFKSAPKLLILNGSTLS